MVRPKKDALVDLRESQDLTAGLIERLMCPPNRAQVFMRDAKTPGLRVRVTEAGAKSFVFEAKLNRNTIRRTIGDVRAWSIDGARAEANRLRVTLDCGGDPREIERQQLKAKEALKVAAATDAILMGTLWDEYLAERRPYWGARHYADQVRMGNAGGSPARRGTQGRGVTVAGLLYPLLAYRLADLTPEVIEAWAKEEAKTRPTSGRLAWRCLKAFLGWCSEQPKYKHLVSVNPAKTKRTREAFGKPAAKGDVLQREQLSVWFDAVGNISNPVVAAYLQTLLLTGARPGEVMALRWVDVNLKWKGLTIRDKVEGERTIPLTPQVTKLIKGLPRRNQWVFSSANSDDGMMSIPRNHHVAACKVAGIDGLTLHGLRRSFKSLTEWLEIPAGVVAQIMGHKPSATAEKHYTVRPLDLLRLHHEKIEAWILEQGGVHLRYRESQLSPRRSQFDRNCAGAVLDWSEAAGLIAG